MAKLFAYGTLMCPEVFEKVTGMSPRAVLPGQVKNHRCLQVRGEVYPGLIQGHGGVVEGLVYTFPSYLWAVFDGFEGERYFKKPVTVHYENGKRELVQAYLLRPECRRLLSRSLWDINTFIEKGKEGFMAAHFSETEESGAGVMKPSFRVARQ